MSLCSRGWGVDLLNAAQLPIALSAGYVRDVRHLLLRRWEWELERIGVPVMPTHPQRLSRSQARIVTCHPFSDRYGGMHDAAFCFSYGADDYSFRALNYRNPHLDSGQPRHFLDRREPLLLGNFAVGVAAPASSMQILPPPEILVAGVAEIATAKRNSVVMWLGVRFCPEESEPWLLDELDNIVLTEPMLREPESTYAYGTVFSRQFAGQKYDLTPEEECALRDRMRYPAKGKPVREQILYEAVCGIFGQSNVIRRYRGQELEGLAPDVWVPSKSLGIEYQGQQHSQRVTHWQGADGLEKQKQRDVKKRSLCKKLGIRLVCFGPRDDLNRESVVSALRWCRVL